MSQQLKRPLRAKRQSFPGSPPGTLVSRSWARPTTIVMRRYTADGFEERPLSGDEDLTSLRDPPGCLWLEVTGLADTALITRIGEAFGVHPLSLEDALEPTQRPKVEHYEGYTFVGLRTLTMTEHVQTQQLSLVFGHRFLLSFQDSPSDDLAPVRQRLQHAGGRVRTRGTDYLAYALVDTLIDHCFPIMERFDDHLERLEDEVLEAHGPNPIELARRARMDLQTIRHAVWPARDVVSSLMRDDVDAISDDTRIYLRDCYDHVIQLQEMIEASREIATGLLEAYLSAVSLRTNQAMRVLTVIATIFIPLTFITGIYGMNFRAERSPWNMPELQWYWGYPATLLVMLLMALGLLAYFRRKAWFAMDGNDQPSARLRRRSGLTPSPKPGPSGARFSTE